MTSFLSHRRVLLTVHTENNMRVMFLVMCDVFNPFVPKSAIDIQDIACYSIFNPFIHFMRNCRQIACQNIMISYPIYSLDISFNPDNAEATFVLSTRTQRFLKII